MLKPTTGDVMAKKKTENGSPSDNKGESISGYFRKVFEENPRWLDTRSNDQLYARWLKDHPGEKVVPEKVRQNLSNVKSVLRKETRKAGRLKKKKHYSEPSAVTTPRKIVKGLDTLEE